MPHKIKLAEHYTGLKPANRSERRSLALAAILVVLVLAILCAVPFLKPGHYGLTEHPGWNPTEVQVLATRVATVYAKDGVGSQLATFNYRAEAQVSYTANGKLFEVWLPASKPTSDLPELNMWLSDKKDRFATVLWNPKVPGEGQVKLKSDIGSNFLNLD